MHSRLHSSIQQSLSILEKMGKTIMKTTSILPKVPKVSHGRCLRNWSLGDAYQEIDEFYSNEVFFTHHGLQRAKERRACMGTMNTITVRDPCTQLRRVITTYNKGEKRKLYVSSGDIEVLNRNLSWILEQNSKVEINFPPAERVLAVARALPNEKKRRQSLYVHINGASLMIVDKAATQIQRLLDNDRAAAAAAAEL